MYRGEIKYGFFFVISDIIIILYIKKSNTYRVYFAIEKNYYNQGYNQWYNQQLCGRKMRKTK